MNILIEQANEIKKKLEDTKILIDNQKLSKPFIEKIGIVNDKLLEVSSTLEKLNINLKKNFDIKLNESELDYIENEKKSNEIISCIMPFITILSMKN